MKRNARLVSGALIAGTLACAAVPAAAAAGVIYEWGKPVGTGGPGELPAVVQAVAGIVAIDAGNQSDLVVLSNGTVFGWGATHVANPSMTAVQIPGLQHVIHAPVDGNHDFAALEQPGNNPSCLSSSSVMTWGLNEAGDLGIGDANQGDNYSVAQDVTTLDCQNVVRLAAAADHMFALTADGRVFVWGGNSNAALGLGTGSGTIDDEVRPTLNPTATALTGHSASGVELTSGSVIGGMLVAGIAYSWGSNAQGQCGCGSSATVIDTPTQVQQGSVRYASIDQGGNLGNNGHVLALTASGTVWAWGDGAQGQLGRGNLANTNVPIQVTGLPPVTEVRAGGMHSLALDSSGQVWAWGLNDYGQVGDGTHTNVLLPKKVLTGMTMISAGSLHSLAE